MRHLYVCTYVCNVRIYVLCVGMYLCVCVYMYTYMYIYVVIIIIIFFLYTGCPTS